MNKYLVMSAAALLSSSGSAMAGTYSFTFATSGGHSYCDGGTISTDLGSSNNAAAWKHTNNNCASGTSQGGGLLERIKGLGWVWILSDNFEAKNYGVYTETVSYTLPRKIRQGREWTLWISLSGTSNFEANSGSLNKVTTGARGIERRGTTSTLAGLKQIIASYRR